MTHSCRRFLVSGRVQGVWFRESTRREAVKRQLTGGALNLPDGRVEVTAAGRDSDLDALAAWLQHGPPMARVDGVIEESIEESGEDTGFSGFTTA
jgi:acylphosphatase